MFGLHFALILLCCAAFPLLFCNFANAGVKEPPEMILQPGEEAYPEIESRRFQGISSMAVSSGGRLWATWYAGPTPGEDKNNYAVLATSDDDGNSWEEVMVVDPDGPGELRAFDPNIWIDPSGRMWWLWAQAVDHGHNPQTWAMIAENPDQKEAGWSEPRHVAPGVMMNKPIVRQNGDWLLPISDWEGRRCADTATAAVFISEKEHQGEKFTLQGAANVPLENRSYDEHMIVERKDGNLWMLIRTDYGIGESVSENGGKTWSQAAPSDIQHTTSRFFIYRLNSGALLLVKHGPID